MDRVKTWIMALAIGAGMALAVSAIGCAMEEVDETAGEGVSDLGPASVGPIIDEAPDPTVHRDQAPDTREEAAPAELPVYQWEPGTEAACPESCANCCTGNSGGSTCCGVGGNAGRDHCASNPYNGAPMCCVCLSTDANGVLICGGSAWCAARCDSVDPVTGQCIGRH